MALDDLAADSAEGKLSAAPRARASGRCAGLGRNHPHRAAPAISWWQSLRSPESIPSLRAVPLTALPGGVRSPSFSPDGNHVVFTWTGPKQDNPDLYVQQIGAGAPLRLTTDGGNDYSAAGRPTGAPLRSCVSPAIGRHELRLIPPLGGAERKLTDIHQGIFSVR